jgi:hypothetical protein
VLTNDGLSLRTLQKIAIKELAPVIRIMATIYRGLPLPGAIGTAKIKDQAGRWRDDYTVTSKVLREILYGRYLVNPKIVILTEEQLSLYYTKLNAIRNVKTKNGILRLLQGDVYCAERMVRFGMIQNDSCRRCFGTETIHHLLSECPYTKAVLALLAVNSEDIGDILGIELSKAELEIRSDIICYLVFRQHVMAPEILVKTTLEKFAKGIANYVKVEKEAKRLLIEIFGS